ncbi:MAG TPA: AzlD domain-containing protein [Candidatus Limnocylindrales bacterium]|nr:AzlD domain-containing protein [Candidatus Limnocylindrales bacterium]
MNAWVVVLTVGAASLAIRALPLLVSDALQLPERAEQGLRHAGIGAMAALLVSALVPRDTGPTHVDVALLASAAIGAAVAWRRSSMVCVLVAGIASYVALTAIGMLV